MMTSRERVLTAFEHREPDRVPTWCGSSPEFWEKAKGALDLDDEGLRLRFGDDFRIVNGEYVGPTPRLSPDASSQTIFGVQRKGIGYGQAVSHPLKDAVSSNDVLAYPWPDPAWIDVSRVKGTADQYQGNFAILGGHLSAFWHDVIDLVGMENLFYMAYDYPDVVSLMFEKVTDFYVQVNSNTFEAASSSIDIFFFGNDFGTQAGPMIGVDFFERFVMPSLTRLIDVGHRHGLKVMMHCCGGFRPLLPSMIRAGLDGVHALQPSCVGMEPSGLKRDFGQSLLLNGAIDSQHVLIEGTPESVQHETTRVLEIMAPGGGYVAGASHDYILGETPLENVLAMFDTIREFKTRGKTR